MREVGSRACISGQLTKKQSKTTGSFEKGQTFVIPWEENIAVLCSPTVYYWKLLDFMPWTQCVIKGIFFLQEAWKESINKQMRIDIVELLAQTSIKKLHWGWWLRSRVCNRNTISRFIYTKMFFVSGESYWLQVHEHFPRWKYLRTHKCMVSREHL